ncbi:uncharacterized protein EV422DRAFT_515774 [Fimicolochytrium jonesii]|uniref:uncharacterized protein n=1 Tax=Fimicolochytrium jonesii TaxID=1396493 RepID=UPI0022FDD158|nr:uncharacterized protein EV422DRAFT_515774 [Fimicolochytrium jonesii]KAI8826207.1 hypothetical protein EV422DRAFT_515774 [Fimicolochytrium jonesii]
MAWALGLTSVQQCSIRPMGLQLCAQAIRAGRGHVPAMASQRPSAGSIHRFLRTPPPKSRRVGDTPPQYIPSPSPLPPQQGQRLGRIQLAKQVPTDHPPTDPSLIPHTSSPKRTILRPILFSLAVVGLSFGVASYERARGRWAAEDKTKLGALFNLDTFFGTDSRSSTPATKPKPGSWETYLPEPLFRIKSMLTHSWDTAKPSLKLVYSIIGLNTTIFLLWRIPSLQPFMLRHFTHHPLSGRSYTLLTSAFSHEGLLHLTFNMYALYGFGTLLQDRVLGSTEQMGAFYVSAAVLASLGSHLFTTLWLGKYRAVKGSLGASGAIWATLTG